MQYCDALEARAKPGAALPADPQSQRDFRHQHDGGFAASQSVLHGSHVDFGFPAASYAMQELHTELAEFESRTDGSERALLFRIQHVGGWRITGVERVFGGVERFLPGLQFSFAQHSFEYRPRNSG